MRLIMITMAMASLVAAINTATSSPLRVGKFWSGSDGLSVSCHRGYAIDKATGMCARKR